MNATPEQFMEEAEIIIPNLEAIIGHTNAIADESDPEVIACYIDAIQASDNVISRVWHSTPQDIRACIREGRGDYAKIQAKCIALGVV